MLKKYIYILYMCFVQTVISKISGLRPSLDDITIRITIPCHCVTFKVVKSKMTEMLYQVFFSPLNFLIIKLSIAWCYFVK